jgi:predicted phage terminase large subunit-like protein
LEAARRWYLPFVQYTFKDFHVSKAHNFLAKELERFEADVRARKSPRLIVTLPPRFGKSELTSRRYPGWLLGRNPDWTVFIVSYSAELAEELSADARRVVISDEYAEIFGALYQPDRDATVELDRQSKAVAHWRIAGRRGGVRAVGVGGSLTGRGATVCIIDDPIKGRKEADSEVVREDLWKWFRGTLRTRIEPGGGIILIHTRWHHDDLTARLLEQRGDRWRVLHLPALAEDGDILGRKVGEPLDPLRYDTEALADIRADTDEREWWAQYQGKPTPDEGDLFKREWFRIEKDPHNYDPDAPGHIFQYWDTAHGKRDPKRKGDRSVCSTWRLEGNVYRLLHVYAARPGYPELKAMVTRLRDHWRARAVVVEDHSSGQSLIQDLRNETTIPILGWKTKNESKWHRADAVTPLWASGVAVISCEGQIAEEVVREHLMFPNGKFDDIVDSCSMALAHMDIWNRGRQKTQMFRKFVVVR